MTPSDISPERATRMRLVRGRGHFDAVIESVCAAQLSVWISTANVKELLVPATAAKGASRPRAGAYHSVLDEFDRLAQSGVELRLLHAKLPSLAFREAFDRHHRLVQGGLELRLCPRVHMKVVIIDGEQLYLGSANWTGAGLGAKSDRTRNFELGMVTDDPRLLDEVQSYYDAIFRGAMCGVCRRRHLCEAPLDTF